MPSLVKACPNQNHHWSLTENFTILNFQLRQITNLQTIIQTINECKASIWIRPLSLKENVSNTDEIEISKIITIWLNSSLGWIIFLSHGLQEEGPYMQFKKPTIEALPIIDPNRLNSEQKAEIISLYEQTCLNELQQFRFASQDETRLTIDNELSRILNVPNLEPVRDMLNHEPIITLSRINEPSITDDEPDLV